MIYIRIDIEKAILLFNTYFALTLLHKNDIVSFEQIFHPMIAHCFLI